MRNLDLSNLPKPRPKPPAAAPVVAAVVVAPAMPLTTLARTGKLPNLPTVRAPSRLHPGEQAKPKQPVQYAQHVVPDHVWRFPTGPGAPKHEQPRVRRQYEPLPDKPAQPARATWTETVARLDAEAKAKRKG